MLNRIHRNRKGFSLLELVIVVVILGIIAAIAIPRMSRGSEGAADGALKANLAVLRNAIDLFIAEHDGVIPAIGDIEDSLVKFSDKVGTTFSATETTSCYFGPYVRDIPALPVGTTRKGDNGIAAADAEGIGWLYTAADGTIKANCTDDDASGTGYDEY